MSNLRLWEWEKFLLEYGPLKRLNPGLIYASLLGWGRNGADKNNPAYDTIEVIANHVNLSETPATPPKPAPEFSQHTEEILLELGYTWEEITRFKEEGAIL